MGCDAEGGAFVDFEVDNAAGGCLVFDTEGVGIRAAFVAETEACAGAREMGI